MKKKLLTVLILSAIVVMMISGCGDSAETGGNARNTTRKDRRSKEFREEIEGDESFFSDPLFDLIEWINSALSDEDEKVYDIGSVPLSQTATYSLSDRMMIQLKPTVDENGNSTGASMVIFYISLAMNTEHKDFETMGSAEKLASLEIMIKDVVASVVQNYTEQECRVGLDGQIREEILSAIQDLFQSDFIYRISISDVIYQ